MSRHCSGWDRGSVLVIAGIIITPLVLIGVSVGATILGIELSRPRTYTSREDPSVGITLSPGVSRAVSFGNSFFCNEVTLEANRTGASVYLITTTPPLTQNGFTRDIGETITVRSLRSWKYHLFPGINFTTLLYIHRPPSKGTFLFSKGHYRGGRHINTFSVSCTAGYSRRYSLRIGDEDDYYLVYSGTSRLSFFPTPCANQSYSTVLQLNISASWPVHSTAGLTNAPRCSVASGGRCSVSVPADSNYRALIVTDMRTDLSENINIRLQCSSNRGWAYAVVVLVPVLIVAIATALLVGLCCCWKKRHRSRQHTQTTRTEAAPTNAVQLQRILYRGHGVAVQQPMTDDEGQQEEKHHDGDLTAAPPPAYKDALDYPAQSTDLPPAYSSLQ